MSTDWSGARRILCIRLDNLGDLLMTTPALRALRHAAPGRRLLLLTSPGAAAAAPLIPEVDRWLVHTAAWHQHDRVAGADADLALVQRLRRERCDAAVVFTVYSQSPLPAALLCRLAGIPRVLAHCRENPYGLLSDWVRETEPQERVRHETQRQLDLVATVGGRTEDLRLSLRVPPLAVAGMLGKLRAAGADPGRPWIVLHPGASAASRRYPAPRFAHAARLLAQESGCQLVFSGSAGEGLLVESIRRQLEAPSFSLAGQLTLGELAALLQCAALLVSNNSGPVHVAAAVGTPVVDLYALTNPQHTPWQVPNRVLFHDVPCKYCYRSVCPQGHNDCLRRVEPAAVAAAALELLGGPAARRAAAG